MEWDRHNCLSFWAIFCPFTSLRTQKNKILKKWKKHLDMSSFYTCIKNHNHRMYASWDMDCDRHNFLYHFGSFFALLPHYWPQRLRFEKNVQNILFHMCTINEDHMMYDSWDIRHDSQSFFIILDHFLPSDPPNNLKNQNFEKMKKTPGDIILLQLSITNNNHVIYSSLDMECNRQNILSFWAIFCPFTPYQFEKPTFKKNQMRYNHFTHVYQKISDYV